jgi:steroid delta-isomerase-like uncharacterized protein
MEPDTRIRQIADAVNNRDWHTYGSYFADDVVVHSPGSRLMGRAARVKSMHDMMAGFPDAEVTVDRVFTEEDWICAELTFEGTHTQPITLPHGPLPATGREVTFPYCAVMRLRGDKVAEVHEYFDRAELMTQLGMLTPV